jgi:K+-transporting ATPase KdpF subunit
LTAAPVITAAGVSREQATESEAIIMIYAVGIVSLFLFVYLVVALIRPEKF